VTATSFEDALRAAGAATALVDTVVAASRQGNATAASSPASSAASSAAGTAAFCITRPPGHHATRDTPLGYCLLNNVALAARHAQRKHRLERVLILDFDLHHGNGTAAIFAKDPSVLFVDTHEAFSIYPPPYAGGAAEDVGEGPGRGATINIPLPRAWAGPRSARCSWMEAWSCRAGRHAALLLNLIFACMPFSPLPAGYAGERCMLSVYDSIIAPAVERFCPDIILVSAGFDAHWKDPFQGLQLRRAPGLLRGCVCNGHERDRLYWRCYASSGGGWRGAAALGASAAQQTSCRA
jgi:acetoin utilization deacetylase AcuC-like enzyme